jgi:MSHA biogenesis protein MshJ
MKAWWLTQSARIDAMSLRERAFLFLSVLLVALALADVVWLSPAQSAHLKVTQKYAAQGVELTRLRAELAAVAQPIDANKAAREDLAAADLQLQQVMQEIKTLAPVTEGGPPLEQVLVQFLRRQPGLTLLGTSTLTAESIGAQSPQPGGAATAVPGLSKRGLELRVAGPYAELTRYVKALETALPTLRWGTLFLKKDQQSAEVMLQVFVVGVQP